MLGSTYFHTYVSDIEIIWTLIALGGLFFSCYNLKESLKDVEALRLRGIRNGRMKIAKTGLKAEAGRAIIQLIYITVGIFAMTTKEPPPDVSVPTHLVIYRVVFQYGFILAGLILALKSYLNYSLRRDLLEYGIRIEPHELEQKEAGSSPEER